MPDLIRHPETGWMLLRVREAVIGGQGSVDDIYSESIKGRVAREEDYEL
jgi:hypothetical protein